MNKKYLLLLLLPFYLLNCQQEKTPNWQAYLGVWESTDAHKLQVEIKQLYTEGRYIDKRYVLKILSDTTKQQLPKDYLSEGNYSFQLGPNQKQREALKKTNSGVADGLPSFTIHPFEEFMYKSSTVKNPDENAPKYLRMITLSTYIGLIDENTIQRKYKGLPDVNFKKIAEIERTEKE